MWVFAERLPAAYWIFSPRALYPAAAGGYSWTPEPTDRAALFKDSADRLNDLLIRLLETYHLSPASIDLIGFSQGAALAYIFALRYPDQIHRLGALSGYLPPGAENLIIPGSLRNARILMTHGTEDPIIPLTEARHSAMLLKPTLARVTYCEEKTGHKLHVTCHRQLIAFFNE
jgi:phospholipase/carboxylesterase